MDRFILFSSNQGPQYKLIEWNVNVDTELSYDGSVFSDASPVKIQHIKSYTEAAKWIRIEGRAVFSDATSTLVQHDKPYAQAPERLRLDRFGAWDSNTWGSQPLILPVDFLPFLIQAISVKISLGLRMKSNW